MTVSRELRSYGPIRLLNIEADSPELPDLDGASHVRVSLPAGRAGQEALEARGFTFGDRTLKVSIIPARQKKDYQRLVRLEPEITRGGGEEILAIALSSFPTDRRFQVTPNYDERLAAIILKTWVDDLEEVLVCRLKGEVAGFLALKDLGDKKISVHLAAVAEKYRSAGVALSLYAGAICRAMKLGFEVVEGRISTNNMPVMNLYAYLGGVFSDPLDIYLKEIEPWAFQ